MRPWLVIVLVSGCLGLAGCFERIVEPVDVFGNVKQGELYSSASTMIDDWYAIEAIDTQTFAINEPKSSQYNTSYLIVGDARAIVFDLYVANNDRAFGPQRRNLFLDERGRLSLYDHGNACFYRPRTAAGIQAGVPRLNAVERNLKALFDMDHKGCHYREFLTDRNLVQKWCDRIKALPDFLIHAAVDRIPSDLARPDASERKRLAEFLLNRRSYLFDHILKSRKYFPGLGTG